jgi:hypothetical protein
VTNILLTFLFELFKIVLLAGLAAGLAVLLLAVLLPNKKCPNCGTPFPQFRKPTSPEQAQYGGNTCKKCGCEADRHGRRIENP